MICSLETRDVGEGYKAETPGKGKGRLSRSSAVFSVLATIESDGTGRSFSENLMIFT